MLPYIRLYIMYLLIMAEASLLAFMETRNYKIRFFYESSYNSNTTLLYSKNLSKPCMSTVTSTWGKTEDREEMLSVVVQDIRGRRTKTHLTCTASSSSNIRAPQQRWFHRRDWFPKYHYAETAEVVNRRILQLV